MMSKERSWNMVNFLTMARVMDDCDITESAMYSDPDKLLQEGMTEWREWIRERFGDTDLAREVEDSVITFYGWLEAKGYAQGMKEGARLMLNLLEPQHAGAAHNETA